VVGTKTCCLCWVETRFCRVASQLPTGGFSPSPEVQGFETRNGRFGVERRWSLRNLPQEANGRAAHRELHRTGTLFGEKLRTQPHQSVLSGLTTVKPGRRKQHIKFDGFCGTRVTNLLRAHIGFSESMPKMPIQIRQGMFFFRRADPNRHVAKVTSGTPLDRFSPVR
jgi:hypothetical protein